MSTRPDLRPTTALAATLAAVLATVLLALPTAHAADERAPGTTFRDCPDCPELVVIPPGQFSMGAPDDEARRQTAEGPSHRVSIPHTLALGRFEVTWDEWERCVEAKACVPGDDEGHGRGRHPVVNIDWHAANAYLRWLSVRTGRTYRLPSEAEWEYAARAGSQRSRPWGDSEDDACRHANVFNAAYMPYKGLKWTWEAFACDDHSETSEPVGHRLPNAFGLYDMLGNVREWTADCFHPSYDGAPDDGRARSDGECLYRVTRGGSWITEPVYVRSAARYWVTPDKPNDDLGFRVLRELP